MKECPKCKTMLEDDELYCHECGTKQEIEEAVRQNDDTSAPAEKKCIHCGETIEADSTFCPFCGKPQTVKKEHPKESAPLSTQAVPKQGHAETPSYKPSSIPPSQSKHSHKEEKLSFGEKLMSYAWIFVLLLGVAVGGAIWYLFSDSSQEQSLSEAQTENEVVDETEVTDLPNDDERKLLFLKDFYRHNLDDNYLRKNITKNVYNKLRNDFDYECDTNDCLATWVFSAYPPGADLELEEGPIISETDVYGKYRVDFKYSGFNGEKKNYYTHTVFLTITQIDEKFLISNYEVQWDDDNQEANVSEEQSSISQITGNELSVRKLTEQDIADFDTNGLRILRNVVYAKYGYRFKSDDLQQYFSRFNWYSPRIDDAEEIYNSLTEIERYNVDFIKEHEK